MQMPFRGALKLACSLMLICSWLCPSARADQYYDAGLKSFQAKKYSDAARYFEQAIKNSPWESNAFYYCALAYHYSGNFKKAAEKYADCASRFPGTPAGTQSQTALKALDPGYLKRRVEADAAANGAGNTAGRGQTATAASASGGSKAQDKGTIEGQPQTRVFYKLNDRDKVVEVSVNGKRTPAIFDANGDTAFSRQQLASIGINTDKGATELRGDVTLGGVVRKNFPLTVYDTGQPARIGSSFLDAFSVTVNETAKTIDLKRKSGEAAGGTSIPFTREGKNLLVNVEVNGHSTQMIFDPDGGSDIVFTAQQAKSIGLRYEDADSEHKTPDQLPVRGDANYVPPEERATPPKLMSIRLKLGPIERPNVSCKVLMQEGAKDAPKKPTFGADFISGGGYKHEIDYKSNKIILTRK